MNTCFYGDCRETMSRLISEGIKVQMAVTSPPYWGLRDYGHPDQLGLEKTPEEYVQHMVEVFRLVRELLKDDGTIWVNLGDSYSGSGRGADGKYANQKLSDDSLNVKPDWKEVGLKPKDLVGIPWRVAFALQADGWYLRSDIIWSKPNPMPESVTDRPTKAHEYLFLLSKNSKYYFDQEAVREENSRDWSGERGLMGMNTWAKDAGRHDCNRTKDPQFNPNGRNIRSVWTIPTQPTPEAHFATYPEALIVPCIKAGTSEKGECPECGKAWVRVIERDGKSSREWQTERGLGPKGNDALMGIQGKSIKGGRPPDPVYNTIGWQPMCDHGKYTCTTCSIVIEYKKNNKEVYHNGERLDEGTEGNNVLSLLQNRIYCTSVAEKGEGILQQDLCREMDDETTPRSVKDSYHEGIFAPVYAGASNGIESGICDGTSNCDGESHRPDVTPDRDSTSQEWEQAGQQDRELGVNGKANTRQRNSSRKKVSNEMSSLWTHIFNERQCPICKGKIEYIPYNPVPQTVLDIFFGSGTTGKVCIKLARKYIGCELQEAYRPIIEKRTAQGGLFT
jgi:DNA modification methylase